MKYLELGFESGVATVTLNRPEIHNAFDETLIAKLTETFVALDDDGDVRIIVLAGAGRSFCAGADLNWMKRMAAFGQDENLRDATALAGELANDVAYGCQQCFGGMGYIRETAIERLWRDARILSIGGGATEVMLEEAAKRL